MSAHWRFCLALLALIALLGSGCASKQAQPQEPGPQAFENAAQKFRAGDYAAAAEGFAQATEQTPGNADAFYFLGLSQQKSLYLKAEAAYRKALSLDASNVPSMEALGILYYSVGDFDKAKPLLEKAASLDGKNAEAALCLGDMYFLDGQCKEAVAAYEKAAALDPGLPAASRRLAQAAKRCGKTQAAKPSGEPAVSSPAPAQAPGKPAPKVIDLNDI